MVVTGRMPARPRRDMLSRMIIEGTAAAGYEAVREAFAADFTE
ncbi:hypothetical protein [Nocardia sp. NPDC004750]